MEKLPLSFFLADLVYSMARESLSQVLKNLRTYRSKHIKHVFQIGRGTDKFANSSAARPRLGRAWAAKGADLMDLLRGTQKTHYPLIKEYTLSHNNKAPII